MWLGSDVGQRALALATHLDDVALWRTGYLYLLRSDLPQAIPILTESLDVCQTGQVYNFLPRVMAYLGYAYALAGHLPEALPLLEQARATGMGNLQQQARIVALLSEAYGLAGRLDDARQGATRALAPLPFKRGFCQGITRGGRVRRTPRQQTSGRLAEASLPIARIVAAQPSRFRKTA